MARLQFSLEQIRSFLAVAQREHVTRAAESVHLSQGAVTQQLRLFERAVDLKLIDRVGRRVRLTSEGRAVAEACGAAMRALQGIDDAARAARGLEVGSLHVGASQTSAAYYLPGPLASFTAAHPRVHLSVVIGNTPEISRQVAAGVLDCGLVEGTFSQAGLLDLAIAEDEVILVAHPGHPLAGAAQLARGELAAHRYLARHEGSGTESLAREILGDAYEAVAKLHLGDLDVVRAATLGRLGFAALPRIAVAEELTAGRLVQLAVPPRRRWIRAIRRPEAGPVLEGFWLQVAGRHRDAT
ncbi:MAG TPA: LysR family transcriptional regulator [Candidatus Dormibacteraeota bacterium]|nr:LysR family transcriptional regulator [Candidatus Dormibacteraeota bacterium]